MSALRTSTLEDLSVIASWVQSPADCLFWAGARVSFPIDPDLLPEAIEFSRCLSFTLEEEGFPCAFGQIVRKEKGRLHLSRLITAPSHRRRGLGRLLASRLLAEALSRRASRVSLNVIPANSAAIALYRSLGFQPAMRPFDEPETDSLYMEHVV